MITFSNSWHNKGMAAYNSTLVFVYLCGRIMIYNNEKGIQKTTM